MRIAVPEFGPLAVAFVRVLVAALILLPLVALRGHWSALRQHYKPVFFVGMLNSGIPFACFAYALLTISSGLSSILNASTPLFGAAIAWLWLKDRPNGSRMVGLGVGFVGVALLASGNASFTPNPGGGSVGLAVLACIVAVLKLGL